MSLLERYKLAIDFSGRRANSSRIAECLQKHLKLCGYAGKLQAIELKTWTEAAGAARAAWAAWAAGAAEAAWADGAAEAAWDASYYAIAAVGAEELSDASTLAVWMPIFDALEAGLWLYFIAKNDLHWIPAPYIQHRAGLPHSVTSPTFKSLDLELDFVDGKLATEQEASWMQLNAMVLSA